MPISDILYLHPETKVQLTKDRRPEVIPRNTMDIIQGTAEQPNYSLIRLTFPHGIPGSFITKFNSYLEITRQRPIAYRIMVEALQDIVQALEGQFAGKYTLIETGTLDPSRITVIVMPETPVLEDLILPDCQQ